jgi:hypothetical protein
MTRRIFFTAVVFSVAAVGIGAEKDWIKLERLDSALFMVPFFIGKTGS